MYIRIALLIIAVLFSLNGIAAESATIPKALSSRDPAAVSLWSAAAEKHHVDALDLCSIAVQESRRLRPDGYLRPWPWTLQTPSEGAMFFSDYDSARAKLEQLIRDGFKNIDVGMMQVNWGHHGQRVSSPAELLQLQRNIDVAAEILSENLSASSGDVLKAIARYHSYRPELGVPYAAAVVTIRNYLRSTARDVCSGGQSIAQTRW